MNPNITALKRTAIIATLVVLGGCASTKALDETRASSEAAKAEAAEAKSLATQAQNTANQALREATAAKQEAAEAKRIAEQNREEMNRMFQRTMQK